MMTELLLALTAIPFVAFVTGLLLPPSSETAMARHSLFFSGLHLFLVLAFVATWLVGGGGSLEYAGPQIYTSGSFIFALDLFFDRITATYATLGAFLTFLITIYCRYYLHGENGYKRFFNTVQLFYLGYIVTIFAGNFEILFAGWEMLGISSFLLIAFYRDRYLPAKNAVKVFSIYRIGDMGILLAAWMSHLLWNENVTFAKLEHLQNITKILSDHTLLGFTLAFLILLSAAAKSAQFPFSSWLPRAMEGPTPSSAIFYGSLSVHIGAFILLRTHAIWEHQTSARFLIGGLGLLTAVLSTGAARVQSSIKSQVAYASLTQIGLIFVEIASGFFGLALFHIAGNAFLRTYQLLVSPSVVSYLIREQFYNFEPLPDSRLEPGLGQKLKWTFYLLSVKEWNLDLFLEKILWAPFHRISNLFSFLANRWVLGMIALYSLAVVVAMDSYAIETPLLYVFTGSLAFLSVLFVIKAFTERTRVFTAWTMIAASHVWMAIAVSTSEKIQAEHLVIYLSGVIGGWALGVFALTRLRPRTPLTLESFQGLAADYPGWCLLFLVACLGLSGFPLTPTFIGEDLVFFHIHEGQAWLACFAALTYVLDGLAIVRMFGRIFLGPHLISHRETAHRSS